MESCSFSAETSFGPSVDPCRRPFDFTLRFEEIFFQLIPSCVFAVASVARLLSLFRVPISAGTGALYAAKLACLATFTSLNLALLVVVSRQDGQTTNASIPAAVLSLVACIPLVILSHFEHRRSHRPSFLISLYLVITALLRAATVRTHWLIEPHSAKASIGLVTLLVQIVLVTLEECSKRKYFLDSLDVSAEETAGFLGRSFFAWLNRSFVRGYRLPLQMPDIVIDDSLASAKMAAGFARLQDTQNHGPLGLLGTAFRCLGLYGLSPVIPRLCMTGFLFSQPFLASSIISYLGSSEATSKNTGYGLIGASVLVYGGIAIVTGWYWQFCYKCATKLRGGLVEVIFAKMLRLRHEKGVEAKVLTLVIGDVHRISTVSAFMHEFWAAPIEAGIGVWLLWRQVGPASLAVLAVAGVSTVASVYIGQNIGNQQGKWLAATEKRLGATKAMLSSLKAIKMMSVGSRVGSAIEKLRVSEFAASRLFRSFLVASVLSSFLTMTLAPVVVFGAYIGSKGSTADFDVARMFSSLILISLVASPLISFFQVIPNLGAALGSAPRIVEFLEKEEIGSKRPLRPDAASASDATFSEFRNGDSSLEVDEKSKIKEIVTPSTLLSIHAADLGWDDKVLLKNVSLHVQQGQHVVVTGPVGCGKSLLVEAILGEVVPKTGSIELVPVSIGYCTQSAWLENISVENNAFRFGDADPMWRNRVIDSCALRDLFKSKGPDTKVGSGGSQISGGEKQRLALARAIATRPKILILDDAFSAIDRSTKRVIFDRLFGPEGIVTEQGITVFQVTQDWFTAQYADAVFTISEDGQLLPYQFSAEKSGEDRKADDEGPNRQGEAAESEEGSSLKEAEFADPASVRDRDVYKLYFKTIGLVHMTIFILATMAFAVALRFNDLWVRWWSEDANLAIPIHNTGYWLGLYAFLGVLPLILISLGISHLMHKIVPISGISLHGNLLSTVLDATFVFISRIDTGSIINRFNQDLLLVDLKLPLDLLNTATYVFTVTVQTVLIVVTAVYLLAAIPVLVTVLWALQHVYLRTSKRLRQLDLETKSDLQTKVSESYAGIATLRAHGWTGRVREEFWAKLDESQRPFYMLFMVQTWLQFALNMIVAGLATVVAGVAVGTQGKVASGAIGVAFLNIVTLGEGLTVLIHSWTSLETSLGAIARISAFAKDTPIEKEVEKEVELPEGWPRKGELVLENVSASYAPEREKVVWSLRDVSVTIRPGERVAVCGRSGSGKSTFLLALLGLVDVPRGRVVLDGVDIKCVSRGVLGENFFVISQDGFLYGETAREALDPEGRFEDDEILGVLRECGVDDKVAECGGLSSLLQDLNLSVGQVQLFALARTVLRAGATTGGVVLLDEATGSVDVETESRIMEIISKKLAGKTVVSVLHRLEAALQYDKILVMDKGQVSCFGTPDEVAKQSELFSS